ncbi:MAG: RNA polymerase sigma-70 factor [Prolixibacteraceae bacterium]|jgi:RNA polymerase sigma-70 factor (ECF subfamily)|nr:RNA polymerase sigma-70 factor [Prolixibacteraceae bacterium]
MVHEYEEQLFLRIKEGDENAFHKAFDLYYPRLCFFADNIIHDFDLSRSVVQQVFVDLWIRHKNLNVLFSLKSYLFQAVRNEALDILKHRKVETKYLQRIQNTEEQSSFHDRIEEAELNDRINAAIQELPPKCREIFMLCRFDDLKYPEIAGRLNISVKTVEMQISIALKKIRKKLSHSQYVNLLAFIFSKKK